MALSDLKDEDAAAAMQGFPHGPLMLPRPESRQARRP